MPSITPAMVKALRDDTSQGMMECKKALEEAGGDIQAAKDILRKKGLITAEKKADRATSEGRIAIAVAPDRASAAMVEVRCETDFCARNDVFRAMVDAVAKLALQKSAGPVAVDDAIKAAVQDTLAKIRENMSYARGVKISAPRIGAYVHHNNKVGVVVGVEGEVSDETLQDLCMHVAFANPIAITPAEVPAELVDKERRFAQEQAAQSGKPPNIVEKMVLGKVGKFLAENALLEQPFVKDDKKKVKDILGQAKIKAFARYAVGT